MSRTALLVALVIVAGACSNVDAGLVIGTDPRAASTSAPTSTSTSSTTTTSTTSTTTTSTTSTTTTSTTSTTMPPAPILTWSDEFNGAAGAPPDPTRWAVEVGGDGWGNRQLEYTSERGASTDGAGNLVITVRPVGADAGLACWYGPCRYESSRLSTGGRFAQRYGHFEIRARMPAGEATWPAFWMLGNDCAEVGWPRCGELDVFEHIGRSGGLVHGSAHGPGYSGQDSVTGTVEVPDPTEFHLYAVDWSEDAVVWSIDGMDYHRLDRDGPRQWVFDRDLHLVLNLAMGGTLAGKPGATDREPQQLVVDYVRVYAG